MIHGISAALLLIASLTCGCGEKNTVQETPAVKLEAAPATLSFNAAGGCQTLSVKSSAMPYAVPGDSWLSTKVGQFASNSSEVTVTVSENPAAEIRESYVSIVCGDDKQKVTISQAAAEKPAEPETDKDKDKDNDDDFLAEVTRGDNLAWKMAERLGMGWNLGNQMDSYNNGVADETGWGNPKATQATFDGLKAKGFTSVRIPTTWMGHIGEAPDYKIDEAWMNRVAELVGYAEKTGLNVILNLHHDGADNTNWLNIKKAAASEAENKAIIEKYSAVWKQIAEKFADKGDFLIFEAFNEIHDGGWGWGDNRSDGGTQYKILNSWTQAFVDAVRSTGGKNSERYLGIPGYSANPDLTMEYMELPKDSAKDKLLVAVHCYDPYLYTLECQYDEWGHTAKNNAAPNTEKEIVDVMAKLKTKYVDAGIPVYLGETGCSNRPTERQKKFQKYYLEFFYKACSDYGIPAFFWDNGNEGSGRESSAVIHHGTGEYIGDGKMMVEAMKKATFTDTDSYTLRSVYDSAPQN